MAIKYKWLAERLKEVVQRGLQAGNDKLPSENELCKRYHVSRQTVRQALKLLEQEGIIEKRQGSGSFATGLSSNHTENRIGLLVSTDQDYIYPELIHDITTTLQQHSYQTDVLLTRNRIDTERALLEEILLRKGDGYRGLIVEPVKSALPNPNLDLYRRLEAEGCATLFLFGSYPALSNSTYLKDANYQGAAMLASRLIREGHTHIAGIFLSDSNQGPERYHGFMETMINHKLTVNDDQIGWFSTREQLVLRRNENPSHLEQIVKRILSSKEPCTAIVCFNDEIAFYVRRLLSSGKISYSGIAHANLLIEQYGLQLASFDDTYLRHYPQERGNNLVSSQVISLGHLPHEMGKRIAEMMIEKQKGLPVSSQEVPWIFR